MHVCPECGLRYDAGGFCGADGARVLPAADALLGTTIARWRLTRVLGEGGMGRVYLGVQPAIGARVAVKVLSEACVREPELVERFFAEARAVNVIRHESIVNVLDLARLDDGRPYIVMEFVEGATLGALARAGRLPLGSVCRVAGEVLAALAAAHDHGIVHRDLKPDNVLVTLEGHAKVLDFGIAKLSPGLQRGDSPRTRTGALLGTPDYMAPEQIQGRAIDGRTDVYAAGVMLFEAVTGQRPFAGETLFELLRAHLEQPPPSPRVLRPELPVELEAVIVRAMAKAPGDRFASAGEMAAALAHASIGLPADAWAALVMRGMSGSEAPTPMAPSPGLIAPPSPSPDVRTSPLALAATAVAPPRRSRTMVIVAVVCLLAGAVIAVAVVKLGSGDPEPARGDQRGGDRDGSSSGPGGAVVTRPIDHGVDRDGVDLDGVTVIETRPTDSVAARIDYDPRKFDGIAYLPRATQLARSLIPDATLIRFDVDGVFPAGHADLTLSPDFDASYEFRSPSASKRPEHAPIGVEVEIPCLVYVTASALTVEVWVTTHEDCAQPLRPPPRCSMAWVWKRAIDAGAPGGNSVAEVNYLSDGWYVSVGDEFAESIPDGC